MKKRVMKKILMAPLDPVHDVGLRFIERGLRQEGYQTRLLPPGSKVEEVIEKALSWRPAVILISRTIGYGVAEIMANLVDQLEAVQLRERVKLGLGGKAVKPELAAELGFDAGFGAGTEIEEVMAFIEGQEEIISTRTSPAVNQRKKIDITAGYSYAFFDKEFEDLLNEISTQILQWSEGKTTPGLMRADIREKRILEKKKGVQKDYILYCKDAVKDFYREGVLPPGVRLLYSEEVEGIRDYMEMDIPDRKKWCKDQPLIFIQYGTGCPVMDILHIRGTEFWGADGILHFDPSWSASSEGLLEGLLTQQGTGTLYTLDILQLIKKHIAPTTLWSVRAHRGLNTPEVVVLAAAAGADMVKINPTYGCLSGGTDPARLLQDGIGAIRYAAKYNLPFDIPVGQELSGVPSSKAFAGMLIVATLGRRLGAKSILNPLFCYSPHVIMEKKMDDNYVDFNAARIFALQSIFDAPIRAGEPVAFMTHTEERVQSAVTTTLHAALASSLGVAAVTLATTDEAYCGGSITMASRIDTLQGFQEALRFLGEANVTPTHRAKEWGDDLVKEVKQHLKEIVVRKNFLQAIEEGLLGSREEGVYPGRDGRETVANNS